MSRGWIRDNWLGLSMAGACLGAAWWVGRTDPYWNAEEFELDDEEAYPLKRSSEVKVVNITNVGDKVYVTIRFPDTDEYYGYEDVFVGDMGDVMLNNYTNSRGQEITFDAEDFGESKQKKAKKVIETAMKKYDEYVADKEAYDDDDIICFEEWFDWHLGDDELEGDEETLEYLKTLPSYYSPETNDWIWKIYHGAEGFESEEYETEGERTMRRLNEMIDSMQEFADEYLARHPVDGNSTQYPDMKVVLPSDDHEDYLEVDNGMVEDTTHAQELAANMVLRAMDMRDMLDDLDMNIEYEAEAFNTEMNAETFNAQMMPPVEGEVKIVKDVTPKGGKTTVEECIDIQAIKADAGPNYYRVKFREPADFENFRVPAWAARAANTMGSKYYDVAGSKVTMGQLKDGGAWKIQSIMVPNKSRVNPELALKIANHIQDRLEKEGKWASKKCQDRETVLIVG